MNKVGTAYVLWLGGLVGLSGLHRLYNGETKTGLLWLGTLGFCGFGQLLDLILIPKMVEVHNARLHEQFQPLLDQNPIALKIERMTRRSSKFIGATAPRLIKPVQPISLQQATIELLKAAELRGGKLSVTQGVMATGLTFKQVETMLKEMLKSGYVEIGNDPETGIVQYEFKELQC